MKLFRYTLLIIALSVAQIVGAATSAADILGAINSKIKKAPAIDAVFTINTGQGPVEGNLQLAGSKFVMETPALKAWYDGKTQWTMLTNNQEVSITEPTADEIMATNPFAILNAHTGYYKARRLADIAGKQRVELTPVTSETGIESFVLTIDPATSWPTAIAVSFSNNNKIDITINKISTSNAKRDGIFTYDSKLFPAMEIVDLR